MVNTTYLQINGHFKFQVNRGESVAPLCLPHFVPEENIWWCLSCQPNLSNHCMKHSTDSELLPDLILTSSIRLQWRKCPLVENPFTLAIQHHCTGYVNNTETVYHVIAVDLKTTLTREMCSHIDMHSACPCCSASRPIPITKVKTLTRGSGFDFLTSGSVHAEVLSWTICLPTFVPIAQAIFLLERKQTDRQTWLNALPMPAVIQKTWVSEVL